MDDLPLVEKYRPLKLQDIVGNQNQIIFLKKFIETGNIPNLILNGEPGGGKTSAVIAFAKEYLGELYNNFCLDLNASDERGIDVVRSKIKIFSQRMTSSDKYKIIILDESDNMTQTAQLALRRIMEQYEDTTKFFFTCNNIENIISSIQSRCKIMHFGKINKEDVIERIKYISNIESINLNEEAIEGIIKLSINPADLREILNKIELIKANFSGLDIIDKEKIYSLCDKPSPLIIKDFLDNLIEKKLKDLIKLMNNLKDDGYQNSDICITLNNEIIETDLFTENMKRQLLNVISNYNLLFLEGNDSNLMLGAMICALYKLF